MRYIPLVVGAMLLLLVISVGAKASILVEEETFVLSEDAIEVRLSIPQVSGIEDSLWQARVNSFLRHTILSFGDDLVREAREVYKFHLDDPKWGWLQWSAQSEWKLTHQDEEYLSLVYYLYQYTGGAHGLTVQAGYTLDLDNHRELTLADLNLGSDYHQKMVDHINQAISEDPSYYFESDVPVDSFDERNFYLSEEGVVVFYQLYEIAAYAMGFPEFTIPW